jgi:hypothetical protein
MYNENMQFVQTIIHDIYRTKRSAIEFLCNIIKSWCASEQAWPRAILEDRVFIEKLEEDEIVEQQFVEAQLE